MNTVNVHASITNLAQMDRLQTDMHRGPVVHQEQNAEAARQEAAQRVRAPVPPDKAEGKKTDPDARREEEKRKKRIGRPSDRFTKPRPAVRNGGGRAIDFIA